MFEIEIFPLFSPIFCVFGLSEKIFFGHFRGCEGELFVDFFSQKVQKLRKLVKKGGKL